MSLFRIREWWNTQIGPDKNFDGNLICVGSVLGSTNNNVTEQILVGSHSGILRVYNPAGKHSDVDLSMSEYRPEHLLLEKQLDYPILQVGTGNFVSSADNLHIAVLHPRKLIIYCLKDSVTGQVEHGNQYALQKAFEHSLQRTAYNFVYGPFGGLKGRDFICVQSVDGALSFFEQENFAFTRFLPNSLLPGPLCYIPMADSFVTVSSQWQLESYKYHMLAVAADSKTKEEAASIMTGKRVAPDWVIQLGEEALDLAVIESSPAQPSIFVLGHRSLFCVTEGGTLRFMKKLDYTPTGLLAYCATSEGYIQYMIGTHTNTVMLYSDITLRWAVQLPFIPVAILRIQFGGNMRGMLCTMDETGHLLCGYLGTDPAFFGIPQTDFRHIDFSDRQRELKKLQGVIRTSTSSISLKSTTKTEQLTIACHMPPELDDISRAYDTEVVDETVPSITVRVILNAKVPLENVQVFVLVPSPVSPHQNAFSFSTLSGSQDLPITFFVRQRVVPVSPDILLKATYAVPGGGSKLVQCIGQLPLQLFCKPCTPSKLALHKITIDCTKPTVNLNDVFTEFVMSGMEGSVQSMGFQLYGNGSVVSILVSKNNQKYRIQSENFESMRIFIKELLIRLWRYHAGVADYLMSFSGNIPLAEYFELLDKHFELQKREEKLGEVLAQRCSQLRAVQKQLISKFRDTTPTPLAHLDGLLEMTHRQVLKIAGAMQDLIEELRAVSAGLRAATEILLCLLKLQNAFSQEETSRLDAAVYPDVDEYPEQGWEERTDAAVTHLLQILSKGHAAASPANHSLPKMSDTTRLKKHITLMCEKLGRGAAERLTESFNASAQIPKPAKSIVARPKLETIAEDTNITDVTESNLGDVTVPAGSALGTLESGTVGHLPPQDFERIEEEETEDFGTAEESKEPEPVDESSYLQSEQQMPNLHNEAYSTTTKNKEKTEDTQYEDLPDNIGSDVPDLDELETVERNNSPDGMANGF